MVHSDQAGERDKTIVLFFVAAFVFFVFVLNVTCSNREKQTNNQVNSYLDPEMRVSNDLHAKLSEGIASAAHFADVSTATRMITIEIPAVANLVMRKKQVGPLKTNKENVYLQTK